MQQTYYPFQGHQDARGAEPVDGDVGEQVAVEDGADEGAQQLDGPHQDHPRAQIPGHGDDETARGSGTACTARSIREATRRERGLRKKRNKPERDGRGQVGLGRQRLGWGSALAPAGTEEAVLGARGVCIGRRRLGARGVLFHEVTDQDRLEPRTAAPSPGAATVGAVLEPWCARSRWGVGGGLWRTPVPLGRPSGESRGAKRQDKPKTARLRDGESLACCGPTPPPSDSPGLVVVSLGLRDRLGPGARPPARHSLSGHVRPVWACPSAGARWHQRCCVPIGGGGDASSAAVREVERPDAFWAANGEGGRWRAQPVSGAEQRCKSAGAEKRSTP